MENINVSAYFTHKVLTVYEKKKKFRKGFKKGFLEVGTTKFKRRIGVSSKNILDREPSYKKDFEMKDS